MYLCWKRPARGDLISYLSSNGGFSLLRIIPSLFSPTSFSGEQHLQNVTNGNEDEN